jgi:hypothetical protein
MVSRRAKRSRRSSLAASIADQLPGANRPGLGSADISRRPSKSTSGRPLPSARSDDRQPPAYALPDSQDGARPRQRPRAAREPDSRAGRLPNDTPPPGIGRPTRPRKPPRQQGHPFPPSSRRECPLNRRSGALAGEACNASANPAAGSIGKMVGYCMTIGTAGSWLLNTPTRGPSGPLVVLERKAGKDDRVARQDHGCVGSNARQATRSCRPRLATPTPSSRPAATAVGRFPASNVGTVRGTARATPRSGPGTCG